MLLASTSAAVLTLPTAEQFEAMFRSARMHKREPPRDATLNLTHFDGYTQIELCIPHRGLEASYWAVTVTHRQAIAQARNAVLPQAEIDRRFRQAAVHLAYVAIDARKFW
jgi:hypothetical protein